MVLGPAGAFAAALSKVLPAMGLFPATRQVPRRIEPLSGQRNPAQARHPTPLRSACTTLLRTQTPASAKAAMGCRLSPAGGGMADRARSATHGCRGHDDGLVRQTAPLARAEAGRSANGQRHHQPRPSVHAKRSLITWPWTSVRRRSTPPARKVSCSWSMPSRVAWMS